MDGVEPLRPAVARQRGGMRVPRRRLQRLAHLFRGGVAPSPQRRRLHRRVGGVFGGGVGLGRGRRQRPGSGLHVRAGGLDPRRHVALENVRVLQLGGPVLEALGDAVLGGVREPRQQATARRARGRRRGCAVGAQQPGQAGADVCLGLRRGRVRAQVDVEERAAQHRAVYLRQDLAGAVLGEQDPLPRHGDEDHSPGLQVQVLEAVAQLRVRRALAAGLHGLLEALVEGLQEARRGDEPGVDLDPHRRPEGPPA